MRVGWLFEIKISNEKRKEWGEVIQSFEIYISLCNFEKVKLINEKSQRKALRPHFPDLWVLA